MTMSNKLIDAYMDDVRGTLDALELSLNSDSILRQHADIMVDLLKRYAKLYLTISQPTIEDKLLYDDVVKLLNRLKGN